MSRPGLLGVRGRGAWVVGLAVATALVALPPGTVAESPPAACPRDGVSFPALMLETTQWSLDDAPWRYAALIEDAMQYLVDYPIPDLPAYRSCFLRYDTASCPPGPQFRSFSCTFECDGCGVFLSYTSEHEATITIRGLVSASLWCYGGKARAGLFCFLPFLARTFCDYSTYHFSHSSTMTVTIPLQWSTRHYTMSSSPTTDWVITWSDVPCHDNRAVAIINFFNDLTTKFRDALTSRISSGVQDSINTAFNEPHTQVYHGPTGVDTAVTYQARDVSFGPQEIKMFACGSVQVQYPDGSSETYSPSAEERDYSPPYTWDLQEYLLESLRLSSTLMRAVMMWGAYRGGMYVQDSQMMVVDANITSSMTWEQPLLSFPTQGNLFNVTLPSGSVLMTCVSCNNVLFDFGFSRVGISMGLHYTQETDTDGMFLQIENFDLDLVEFTVTKPRILPQSMMTSVLRSAMNSQRDRINDVLQRNPYHIDTNWAAYFPTPTVLVVPLNTAVQGPHAYAELSTLCTCNPRLGDRQVCKFCNGSQAALRSNAPNAPNAAQAHSKSVVPVAPARSQQREEGGLVVAASEAQTQHHDYDAAITAVGSRHAKAQSGDIPPVYAHVYTMGESGDAPSDCGLQEPGSVLRVLPGLNNTQGRCVALGSVFVLLDQLTDGTVRDLRYGCNESSCTWCALAMHAPKLNECIRDVGGSLAPGLANVRLLSATCAGVASPSAVAPSSSKNLYQLTRAGLDGGVVAEVVGLGKGNGHCEQFVDGDSQFSLTRLEGSSSSMQYRALWQCIGSCAADSCVGKGVITLGQPTNTSLTDPVQPGANVLFVNTMTGCDEGSGGGGGALSSQAVTMIVLTTLGSVLVLGVLFVGWRRRQQLGDAALAAWDTHGDKLNPKRQWRGLVHAVRTNVCWPSRVALWEERWSLLRISCAFLAVSAMALLAEAFFGSFPDSVRHTLNLDTVDTNSTGRVDMSGLQDIFDTWGLLATVALAAVSTLLLCTLLAHACLRSEARVSQRFRTVRLAIYVVSLATMLVVFEIYALEPDFANCIRLIPPVQDGQDEPHTAVAELYDMAQTGQNNLVKGVVIGWQTNLYLFLTLGVVAGLRMAVLLPNRLPQKYKGKGPGKWGSKVYAMAQRLVDTPSRHSVPVSIELRQNFERFVLTVFVLCTGCLYLGAAFAVLLLYHTMPRHEGYVWVGLFVAGVVVQMVAQRQTHRARHAAPLLLVLGEAWVGVLLWMECEFGGSAVPWQYYIALHVAAAFLTSMCVLGLLAWAKKWPLLPHTPPTALRFVVSLFITARVLLWTGDALQRRLLVLGVGLALFLLAWLLYAMSKAGWLDDVSDGYEEGRVLLDDNRPRRDQLSRLLANDEAARLHGVGFPGGGGGEAEGDDNDDHHYVEFPDAGGEEDERGDGRVAREVERLWDLVTVVRVRSPDNAHAPKVGVRHRVRALEDKEEEARVGAAPKRLHHHEFDPTHEQLAAIVHTLLLPLRAVAFVGLAVTRLGCRACCCGCGGGAGLWALCGDWVLARMRPSLHRLSRARAWWRRALWSALAVLNALALGPIFVVEWFASVPRLMVWGFMRLCTAIENIGVSVDARAPPRSRIEHIKAFTFLGAALAVVNLAWVGVKVWEPNRARKEVTKFLADLDVIVDNSWPALRRTEELWDQMERTAWCLELLSAVLCFVAFACECRGKYRAADWCCVGVLVLIVVSAMLPASIDFKETMDINKVLEEEKCAPGFDRLLDALVGGMFGELQQLLILSKVGPLLFSAIVAVWRAGRLIVKIDAVQPSVRRYAELVYRQASVLNLLMTVPLFVMLTIWEHTIPIRIAVTVFLFGPVFTTMGFEPNSNTVPWTDINYSVTVLVCYVGSLVAIALYLLNRFLDLKEFLIDRLHDPNTIFFLVDEAAQIMIGMRVVGQLVLNLLEPR